MGTDKHGRRRRAIRRLTQRTIPLPTSASLPPPAASLAATPAPTDGAAKVSGAQASPLGAAIASSLAELRLPDGQSKLAAEAAGADAPDAEAARERHDTKEDAETEQSAPPLAAEELAEDEPETNPKLPFLDGDTDASDRQASLPPPIGSDRPKQPARRLDTPPPLAAGDAALAPELPGDEVTEVKSSDARASSGDAASDSGELATADRKDGRTDETADTIEIEEATSQIPKPLALGEAAGAADGKDRREDASAPKSNEVPPPRLDSDLPTRPRIELSEEMAFAAGRVTSLDVPPFREDAPPKRGSKIPPSGEPRVISSLTGRRSSIPVSTEEDDEAARPAVVVTRAKIISDRPPKPSDRPSKLSDRAPVRAERSDRPPRPEPERSERAAKEAKDPKEAKEVDRPRLDGDRAKVDRNDRPSDVLERAARQEAERPPSASMRPSRRPGSSDLEEFETLDIEDGVMETPALSLSRDSITGAGSDVVSSKAPPPPPQQKRGAPPAQVAPVAPPKAPPPPPRAPSTPLTAASAIAPALAAVPNPPANPAAAAPTAAASANASSNPSPPVVGGSGSAAKMSGQKQPRRRQWWETLFSDDYLRTVVRPTSAQIARQVDFMHASLGVSKGSSVLDVGCGLGQHALEFARRGCLVVALDLALPMITRAAEDAQQEGLRINFLHKDIRDIGFEGTFDAVICVGTTFGFFDDEQNREVLGRLANALKPGGRLLLEVVNRDHVMMSQPNLQWFEGDGCVVMEESDFNYYSSRLTVKRTMMREDGRQSESEYSIRLYALHELGQMMQQVGFRVKEVSGQQATRGVFFGAQSNRIILLAERKTPNPARANGNGHSDAPPAGES